MENSKKLFTAEQFYTVRYIAIIAMFIDHLSKVLNSVGLIPSTALFICNLIGRIAFPLFALQLVESFHSTSNKYKHLFTLFIITIASEIPFDICFTYIGGGSNFASMCFYQNVGVTLLLAFCYLMCANWDWKSKLVKDIKNVKIRRFIYVCLHISFLLLFCILSNVICGDYAVSGIICVALLEMAKHSESVEFWRTLALVFILFVQMPSIWVIVPMILLIEIYCVFTYTGKTVLTKFKWLSSKSSKIICRYFYPIHLLVLGVVRLVLSSVI